MLVANITDERTTADELCCHDLEYCLLPEWVPLFMAFRPLALLPPSYC